MSNDFLLEYESKGVQLKETIRLYLIPGALSLTGTISHSSLGHLSHIRVVRNIHHAENL